LFNIGCVLGEVWHVAELARAFAWSQDCEGDGPAVASPLDFLDKLSDIAASTVQAGNPVR
jgi:hypothetical protein